MNYANMNLAEGWRSILKEELKKPYFQELWKFIEKEYESTEYEVYPPKDQIFRALNLCPLEGVKVVIVGQDPYPKKGYANGLCFSLSYGVNCNGSSLEKIFEEIDRNFPEKKALRDSDLARWAEQGVLLLNSILTVQENNPKKGHKHKGWENFTRAIIGAVSGRSGNGVVFMLWGAHAQRYINLKSNAELIDCEKNCVLICAHPASRNGKWSGNNHFKTANEVLKKRGLTPIDW